MARPKVLVSGTRREPYFCLYLLGLTFQAKIQDHMLPPMCHPQHQLNICHPGRHLQLEKLDGGGDRDHDGITPSFGEVVTGFFSLPDFSHYLVNSVSTCQAPRAVILLHCPFLSSFGTYVCQLSALPSSELRTQALHFSLETWIPSPDEVSGRQAVNFYPRIWNARKCSMCISVEPVVLPLPPAPMADITNKLQIFAPLSMAKQPSHLQSIRDGILLLTHLPPQSLNHSNEDGSGWERPGDETLN